MTCAGPSASLPSNDAFIIRELPDLDLAGSASAIRVCFGLEQEAVWDAFLRRPWPGLRELTIDYYFEMTDGQCPVVSLAAIARAVPHLERLIVSDLPIELGAVTDTLESLTLWRSTLQLPLLHAPRLRELSATQWNLDVLASIVDGTVSPQLRKLVLDNDLDYRQVEACCDALAQSPLRIPLESLWLAGSSPAEFDEASVRSAARFTRWAASVATVHTGHLLMDMWSRAHDKAATCIYLLEHRHELLAWLSPTTASVVRSLGDGRSLGASAGNPDWWELHELPHTAAPTPAHAWVLFRLVNWDGSFEKRIGWLAEELAQLPAKTAKGAILQELPLSEFLRYRHQDEPLWNRIRCEVFCGIWVAQTIYTGQPCGWLLQTQTQWLWFQHVMPGL